MIRIVRHNSRNGLLPRRRHRACVAEVEGGRVHLTILKHGEVIVELPAGHTVSQGSMVLIEVEHIASGDTWEPVITRIMRDASTEAA